MKIGQFVFRPTLVAVIIMVLWLLIIGYSRGLFDYNSIYIGVGPPLDWVISEATYMLAITVGITYSIFSARNLRWPISNPYKEMMDGDFTDTDNLHREMFKRGSSNLILLTLVSFLTCSVTLFAFAIVTPTSSTDQSFDLILDNPIYYKALPRILTELLIISVLFISIKPLIRWLVEKKKWIKHPIIVVLVHLFFVWAMVVLVQSVFVQTVVLNY